MDSVLVRFKDKSYYVSYDDLLNKANDKLFAYEDEALEINAKLNGQTLMFDKSEMEDKLKGDINMPTRMPSNLATENAMSNKDDSKIIKNIYTSTKTVDATNDDLKQFIKDDAWEFIDAEGLSPVASNFSADWRAEQGMYDELVGDWAESTLKQLLKLKNRGNIMTNEQKLRKHIREMIIEILKEGGDPYGRPDEDKYLFKTGQDYLAGIEAESISEEGEEESGKKEYQRFFSQTLAKFGYSGVASIPDEKKKEFYNYIDANWTSSEENAYQRKTEYANMKEEGEKPSAEELEAKEKAAKEKAEKTAYQRFFSQALAKFGYSGPASIPDEKKRAFYDFIDQNWTSKREALTSESFGNTEELEVGTTYTYMPKETFVDTEGSRITTGMEFILKSFKPGDFVDVENANQPGDFYQIEYDIFVDDFKNAEDWTDPAGGEHSFDETDPAKMYEDKLKETSATGGVAGYETPMAFTGKKGVSKKQKSIANQLGYELVDKSYAVKEQGDVQDLREGMDALYFKDDSLTSEQKLGLAMRHVRNSLQEVEKIVSRTIKMKNEDNIDSTKVGKRTYSALRRINEKVIRLMVAMNDLK